MLFKLFTRIVWKKYSILIPVVFFCPKNPKLYIADTFLGTTGVRYKQVRLYTYFWVSLSVNPTKWSNTRKQFVGNRNIGKFVDHFVGLVLKGLIVKMKKKFEVLLSENIRFSGVSRGYKKEIVLEYVKWCIIIHHYQTVLHSW